MNNIDKLLLLTGGDIPFPEATLVIHQPTLAEIGVINEDKFFKALGVLNFDKENLSNKDKIDLESLSNFDIIMSIMTEKGQGAGEEKDALSFLFSILFPMYQINFEKSGIFIIKPKINELHTITDMNFKVFLDILRVIFCMEKDKKDPLNYNPEGNMAKDIARKLMEGRRRAAALKGEQETSQGLLARYMSILAIGNQISLKELSQYTLYQIYDQISRFELYLQQDFYFKAKLAGAQDLKEVDNWMKELHS